MKFELKETGLWSKITSSLPEYGPYGVYASQQPLMYSRMSQPPSHQSTAGQPLSPSPVSSINQLHNQLQCIHSQPDGKSSQASSCPTSSEMDGGVTSGTTSMRTCPTTMAKQQATLSSSSHGLINKENIEPMYCTCNEVS